MLMVKKSQMYLHLRFWPLNKGEPDSSLPHLRSSFTPLPLDDMQLFKQVIFQKMVP